MSALVITISGNSVQELREKVRAVAVELGVMGSVPYVAPDAAPSVEVKPGKEKKTKKADETAPLANGNGHSNGATMFDDAHDAAPAALAIVTKEQAMKALQDLNGAKGLPVAREILAKFKAARFSELKDGDLAAFVQACTQAAIA